MVAEAANTADRIAKQADDVRHWRSPEAVVRPRPRLPAAAPVITLVIGARRDARLAPSDEFENLKSK